MMDKKAILRSAVSAVAFIFTMFGGFFLKVAPPEEVDAKFAVGITSFCVLVTLLVISNLRPKGRAKVTPLATSRHTFGAYWDGCWLRL
jgi:hypothetical protein